MGCRPSFCATQVIASSEMKPKCSWMRCSSGMEALRFDGDANVFDVRYVHYNFLKC